MYQNAAILAAIVLIYSAVAGRVARSWLSGPILFTGAGLVLGPLGLDVLRLDITATDLKAVAEAALAMVLFTDAARADLGVVRRNVALPERLLLIGLPLTIVLGFLAAVELFPALDLDMIWRWIALALALAGCASNQEYLMERQVLVDEFNNTTPVCQGEQDCKVKWQAARLWVARNRAWNIQTAHLYSAVVGEVKIAEPPGVA